MVIYNVWELKVYTDMRYDNSQPIVHINKKKKQTNASQKCFFFLLLMFSKLLASVKTISVAVVNTWIEATKELKPSTQHS